MKKFLSLALAVVLFLSLTVPAFAADEDSFQTDVTYTVPEPETCTYTLEIPRSLPLGETFQGTIQIIPISVEIPASKQVVVRISSSTFSGGSSFFLYKDKDQESEARISAHLSANKQYLSGGETIVTFENGANTSSATWGEVNVSATPSAYQNAAPGTYTGSVYFSVSVEDK